MLEEARHPRRRDPASWRRGRSRHERPARSSRATGAAAAPMARARRQQRPRARRRAHRAAPIANRPRTCRSRRHVVDTSRRSRPARFSRPRHAPTRPAQRDRTRGGRGANRLATTPYRPASRHRPRCLDGTEAIRRRPSRRSKGRSLPPRHAAPGYAAADVVRRRDEEDQERSASL